MPSIPRPEEYVDGFAPVLLANLVPLVGVVALGWDAATLSVIYAAEVVLSLPLAAAKSLFAQRHPPTERNGFISVGDADLTGKRGSVEVVGWLPPVYPRNVPFTTGVFAAVVFLPVFLGAALSNVLPLAATLARPAVLGSVAGLFLAAVAETARVFFRHREYQAVSPYAVIETPVRRGFFVAFILFVAPGLEAAFGGAGVLGLLAVGKLLVEYSAYRADRDDGGRFGDWLAGPDEGAERDPVVVPDAEPVAAFGADRRAVLLGGVFRALVRLGPFCVSFGTLAWFGLLAALPLEGRALLAGATLAVPALCVAALAVRVGSFYVLYGPLEYRRQGDRIVAYDTWLDEPQWSAPVTALRDVEVVADRLADRLLDARTFEVTTGWGDDATERRVGPLADAEAAVGAFDLPVETTELDPIDRRYALGAAVTAAFVGLVYAAVAAGPRESLEPFLVGVFLFPFPALVVVGVWRRAYPDDGDDGWPTPEYSTR